MRIALVLLLLAAIPVRADLTIDQLTEQAQLVEGSTAVRDLPGWQGVKKIVVIDRGDDLSDFDSDVEITLVDSVEEAMREVADAQAIIGSCSQELIEAAPLLLWVQINFAGAERCLDVPRIAGGQVVLSNMQKMSSPVIAEHAIAMAMALSRKLPSYLRAMEDGKWLRRGGKYREQMRPIAGRNLLVVGLGGIGTEVARLGNALGMTVTGTRNSSRKGPPYMEYVGLSHELLNLAAKADIIVNALPLTESTRDLFDAEFFDTIRDGAIFVNVGRGGSVVTADLVKALRSGRLGGAGLDVTAPEPLTGSHPLWAFDNVIITPHVSSAGDLRERHAVLLRENLRRFIGGQKLLNVVDPEKGY